MLDANAATTSRPVALVKISSNASVTSRSDPVNPRRSMFVLSASSARTPSRAELGEPVHVEVLAVDRRLVDLEVAGVDDHADGRPDRERHAIGHAVRDPDELNRERADGDFVARPDGDEATAHVDTVLLQLRLEQRQRQRRRVDRSVDERHDVRHAADVVLVAVRQHQRRHAPLLLRYVRSGMIRSTPSSSGSGNITPASTTIVVSPQVSASMFMPNSPSPPRGTISSIAETENCAPRRAHIRAEQGGAGAAWRSSVRLLGAPDNQGRDGRHAIAARRRGVSRV